MKKPNEDNDVKDALMKLLQLKQRIGNINKDIHNLASHLASSFLRKKHGIKILPVKPAGSSGFDIDLKEIVGEIKTTTPYYPNDFGAKQKEEIRKDLERLEKSIRRYKYFFVIDDKTERILKSKYCEQYPTVKIVNLLKATTIK